MSTGKFGQSKAFWGMALGVLGENLGTAVVAVLVTLILTDGLPGELNEVIVLLVVVFAWLVAMAFVLVWIRGLAEKARDEHAGAVRPARLEDVTWATSDVLAEQADVMAELRVLRAEVAELRRPWWLRWGR